MTTKTTTTNKIPSPADKIGASLLLSLEASAF
jgi:hypothetical protein